MPLRKRAMRRTQNGLRKFTYCVGSAHLPRSNDKSVVVFVASDRCERACWRVQVVHRSTKVCDESSTARCTGGGRGSMGGSMRQYWFGGCTFGLILRLELQASAAVAMRCARPWFRALQRGSALLT